MTIKLKRRVGGGGLAGQAILIMYDLVIAVFSLAYLRHVGPTSLQYRILFDAGNKDNPKDLLWLQAPPTPCPPIMPRILLGEITGRLTQTDLGCGWRGCIRNITDVDTDIQVE